MRPRPPDPIARVLTAADVRRAAVRAAVVAAAASGFAMLAIALAAPEVALASIAVSPGPEPLFLLCGLAVWLLRGTLLAILYAAADQLDAALGRRLEPGAGFG